MQKNNILIINKPIKISNLIFKSDINNTFNIYNSDCLLIKSFNLPFTCKYINNPFYNSNINFLYNIKDFIIKDSILDFDYDLKNKIFRIIIPFVKTFYHKDKVLIKLLNKDLNFIKVFFPITITLSQNEKDIPKFFDLSYLIIKKMIDGKSTENLINKENFDTYKIKNIDKFIFKNITKIIPEWKLYFPETKNLANGQV